MINFKAILLSLLIFSLSLTCPLQAFAGFGVSPSEIFNKNLKPGSVYEQEIILSNSEPIEDTEIIVEPDMGDETEWFSFEPGKTFIMPKGQQRFPMKVIVTVPEDAKLQQYEGVIRIKAATPGQEKKEGVSIVKGARMDVNLVTTNVTVTRLLIQMLQIDDINLGDPLKLVIKAKNEGNASVAPSKVELELMDLNQKSIDTFEDTQLEKLAPGKEGEIVAEFSPKVEPGEYFANVKIYLDRTVLREERLVFKVKGNELPVSEQQTEQQLVEMQGKNVKTAIPVKQTVSILNTKSILGILLAVIVFVITTLLTAKLLNKKMVLWKKILSIVSLILVVIVLMVLLIKALIIAGMITQAELANMPEIVPQKIETQQQTTANGNVQGTKVQALRSAVEDALEKEDVKSQPLTVTQAPGEVKYNVYKEPNLSTTIVYTASEGEQLSVVEQKTDWYKVKLPSGEIGWLPINNVKASQ